MKYKNFTKRLIDIFISFMLLLLLGPLFIIVTFVLTITMGGHAFFIQTRPGRNEKLFKIFKFRTMKIQNHHDGSLQKDIVRITRFGSFIRKTSIDEIPQLINVLRGEMSLIGPRPLLVEYLSLYNEFQKKRHLVRPGITGWAQVNGRNAISWENKFSLDVWYVDHISFSLDVKIFIRTIKKVFKKDGINKNEDVTMEKFIG